MTISTQNLASHNITTRIPESYQEVETAEAGGLLKGIGVGLMIMLPIYGLLFYLISQALSH